MNANNVEKRPTIKRETKNKIRVDFDRTPLKERLKAKLLSLHFWAKIVLWIFRIVLMVGISYVVLFPFITKVAGSFMSPEDFMDQTVRLIPKNFSLDLWRHWIDQGYWNAFANTFSLSLILAVIQTFICCLIGYGFAKFKFRGRNIIFMLVMLTMIVPHRTIEISMSQFFTNFDILGIVRLFKGGGIELFGFNIKDLGEGVAEAFEGLNILPDTIQWGEFTKANGTPGYAVDMAVSADGIDLVSKGTKFPLILLSMTGLAFKNGLYIFLLRQFFRGIPDELEESAYMDGSGTLRTFFRIILPLSLPMMITVFLFSFCWQWTDTYYTGLFLSSDNKAAHVLTQLINNPSAPSISTGGALGGSSELYNSAGKDTLGLMIILPLVILYGFCQKFLVQGIEHSGIAN